ncbi:hypothetical protein SISSUDRAFT_338635 [Sistotremastrum suecicum HHB10207 ss-3]|uniref:SRR1-like domain-containing protein n=1 Tax=Sistotremastrum suecicum HHB10207 ss-3 TaxID=1314776 RepID=A0A166IWX2_9AGAM|nr:hypothetical protein SISSUDRAFT_338635 [Sistotremastrum suecicum HHB10207 ss-3]
MMAPLEAPCTSAVCLGLGSPTDSRNSRAQLWLLLEICKSLNIPRHSIKLYDPAFSEQDIADLSDLGLSIVSENLHGKYIAITPTFFYLPHCGLAIYENLIRSNWQAGLVRHLRLLANEFLNYVER